MGFACNISFKHEDNKKKIVDWKCYLFYSEIFIQKTSLPKEAKGMT